MMARVVGEEIDYATEAGLTNTWNTWLVNKQKTICWRELYDLDVGAREFAKKKERGKVSAPDGIEEMSSPNHGLEGSLKVFEEKMLKTMAEMNLRLDTFEKRFDAIETTQRVLRKKARKMARRVTSLESAHESLDREDFDRNDMDFEWDRGHFDRHEEDKEEGTGEDKEEEAVVGEKDNEEEAENEEEKEPEEQDSEAEHGEAHIDEEEPQVDEEKEEEDPRVYSEEEEEVAVGEKNKENARVDSAEEEEAHVDEEEEARAAEENEEEVAAAEENVEEVAAAEENVEEVAAPLEEGRLSLVVAEQKEDEDLLSQFSPFVRAKDVTEGTSEIPAMGKRQRYKCKSVKHAQPKKRGRPRKADNPQKFTTPKQKRQRAPSQWVQDPFTEGKTDEAEGQKKKTKVKA